MAYGGSQAALKIDADALVPRRISRFALEQRSRLDDMHANEGIRRLMWAILKDTLRCYQNYIDARSVHEQRLFRDADRWIRSEDLRWIFSFETICGVLGIDSDYLRSEVMRWRRTRNGRCGRQGGKDASA